MPKFLISLPDGPEIDITDKIKKSSGEDDVKAAVVDGFKKAFKEKKKKFIVTLDHNGERWPLRGTCWAFSMDRAQSFETREAAQAQLDKAKQFMSAKQYKAAVIEEI